MKILRSTVVQLHAGFSVTRWPAAKGSLMVMTTARPCKTSAREWQIAAREVLSFEAVEISFSSVLRVIHLQKKQDFVEVAPFLH